MHVCAFTHVPTAQTPPANPNAWTAEATQSPESAVSTNRLAQYPTHSQQPECLSPSNRRVSRRGNPTINVAVTPNAIQNSPQSRIMVSKVIA